MTRKKARKTDSHKTAKKVSGSRSTATGEAQKTSAQFDEAFRRGTRLLHQGKAQESVPYLEQAHQINPDSADIVINLGGAYIMTKKFSNAVAVLSPASQNWPNNSRIWINLGAAHLGNPVLARREDQETAIAALKHALEIDPAAPSVAYNIGLIYRDMGETDKAIYWFGQAVIHNPTDKDARSLLARLESSDAAN
jgi:Flp pilus assembly protein TadD